MLTSRNMLTKLYKVGTEELKAIKNYALSAQKYV